MAEFVSSELFVAGRAVCNEYYYPLTDALLSLFSDRIPIRKKVDSNACLSSLLRALQYSQDLERTLHDPLSFIKRHVALYRHSSADPALPSQMKCKFVYKAVSALSSLAVSLRLLSMYKGLDTSAATKAATQFYCAYYSTALQHKAALPLRETFDGRSEGPSDFSCGDQQAGPSHGEEGGVEVEGASGAEEPRPPQNKSIDWYKKNGWKNYLKSVPFVVQAGAWKGKVVETVQLNGNNTLVRALDGSGEKFVLSRYTISFVNSSEQ